VTRSLSNLHQNKASERNNQKEKFDKKVLKKIPSPKQPHTNAPTPSISQEDGHRISIIQTNS